MNATGMAEMKRVSDALCCFEYYSNCILNSPRFALPNK